MKFASHFPYFHRMTRRYFHQLISTAAVGNFMNYQLKNSEMVKPKVLRAGDSIGLIAPGSAIPPHKIEQAVLTCSSLGLRPIMGKYVSEVNGFLAGTDQQRLEDLHDMFRNPEIRGIWCLRGGYGCTRLLPDIDYELISRNPKIFIGYSDISALHLSIGKMSHLVTYHGPVGSSDPTDYTIDMLKQAILVDHPFAITSTVQSESEQYIIREGAAQGKLTGGNLSLLAAMTGTAWLPSFAHKIVCLEDIGEKPYRIDRMLVQLFQATDLNLAAGIILGQFKDCEAKTGESSWTLEETLRDQFKDFQGPVLYGFSFGHIADQCTFPFGIQAKFNTRERILQLLESPTIS